MTVDSIEPTSHPPEFSILCWNIGNPSRQRAAQQAEWLRARSEDVFILTETKRSEGCSLLQRYFEAYGFTVLFPLPDNNEYGVMLVARGRLRSSERGFHLTYLSSRLASAQLEYGGQTIHLVGIYVPSRDATSEKIMKKRQFVSSFLSLLENGSSFKNTIVCGDLNILEPDHVPHYPFFLGWEYEFYTKLCGCGLKDAFRLMNGTSREYSWVGRTGDGYRYDHCFISQDLVPALGNCAYLHEPRKQRLSDHSALIVRFKLAVDADSSKSI